MSDDLVVSGGGGVLVATDSLLGRMRVLEDLAHRSRETGDRLRRIDDLVTPAALESADAPLSAAHAEEAIHAASRTLHRVEQLATEQALALRVVAASYGAAELSARSALEAMEGWLAGELGMILPLTVLALLPVLLPVAAGAVGAVGAATALDALLPGAAAGLAHEAQRWLERHARLLTNPVTVGLIRTVVSNLDELEVGGRLTPIAGELLGERGLGITGVATSTVQVMALAGVFGMLRETDVTVSRVSLTSQGAPASGFAERLDRVPQGPAAQIRVEKYTMPDGEERFEVYIGGTVTFDPVSGNEPFDLTSDVAGVAEVPAASSRAVVDALHQAGATDSSAVVFTGYSQGGLIAAQVAASDQFRTAGLVTFGAPIGGYEIGDDYPAVLVQHTDDLVPALGGDRHDLGPVVVERQAYDDEPLPAGESVPGHLRPAYGRTADLMDDAGSTTLRDASARLEAVTAGADSVEVSTYHAERVQEGGEVSAARG